MRRIIARLTFGCSRIISTFKNCMLFTFASYIFACTEEEKIVFLHRTTSIKSTKTFLLRWDARTQIYNISSSSTILRYFFFYFFLLFFFILPALSLWQHNSYPLNTMKLPSQKQKETKIIIFPAFASWLFVHLMLTLSLIFFAERHTLRELLCLFFCWDFCPTSRKEVPIQIFNEYTSCFNRTRIFYAFLVNTSNKYLTKK